MPIIWDNRIVGSLNMIRIATIVMNYVPNIHEANDAVMYSSLLWQVIYGSHGLKPRDLAGR